MPKQSEHRFEFGAYKMFCLFDESFSVFCYIDANGKIKKVQLLDSDFRQKSRVTISLYIGCEGGLLIFLINNVTENFSNTMIFYPTSLK